MKRPEYRGFVVLVAGLIAVLGLFVYFVLTGWPGDPSPCVYDSPNTCYCEAFDLAAVESGARGTRQPVNTWFNLYSLITAFIVAYSIYRDRSKSGGSEKPNLFFSYSLIPDLYIFAVLFLGLGSMWFHGSLTAWGGIVDGFSMYVFAAFLPFYTIRRINPSNALFWSGYIITVVLFTFLHTLLPAFVNILILVVAYFALEIYVWIRMRQVLQGSSDAQWYWGLAIASIVAATFFWWASHTGNFMCGPESFFQPHGLLWHPLAGVMAVLMYFYWREEEI